MNKPLLLTIALVSACAFAQEVPPPPPPPLQPLASPVDSPMVEEDPGGRVRWGASAGVGWFLPHHAITFGAEGKIGYQISNMFSAYAVLGGVVGVGVAASVSGSSVKAAGIGVGYYYFGAIAELMFANIFYVGAGPVLAGGGAYSILGIDVGPGSGAVKAIVVRGFSPGLDLRLGLGLGRPHGPPSFRRGGFNLGLTAKVLFHPDTVVTRAEASSTGGSIDIDTSELTISVTPMITFGYDAR